MDVRVYNFTAPGRESASPGPTLFLKMLSVVFELFFFHVNFGISLSYSRNKDLLACVELHGTYRSWGEIFPPLHKVIPSMYEVWHSTIDFPPLVFQRNRTAFSTNVSDHFCSMNSQVLHTF